MRVAFGIGSVEVPDGWREVERVPGRVAFASADDAERVTISELRFSQKPTLEDFALLLHKRLEVERMASPTVSVSTKELGPYKVQLLGADATGRLFSGGMFVVETTLLTIYVEGHVPAARVAGSFKAFATGYRRRTKSPAVS